MASQHEPEKTSRTVGRLLVIGGHEDPDPDDMVILPHLVEMAGGVGKARIVVCGSSSSDPTRVERIYRDLFGRVGVADLVEARIDERTDAEKPELLKAIDKATAVFFTGGDQLRLASTVGGTPFMERVRNRLFQEGMVVAGTSAGAAGMSSTMLISGPQGGTVRRSDVTMAPGLGLLRDTVIDTHFNQRGRATRLLTIAAQNPQVLAIGLDEDTAIEVHPGGRFDVIGRGAVTVFDGRVTHSNAADADEDEVLALFDVALHVLPQGYGYDLQTKRPIAPPSDGERDSE